MPNQQSSGTFQKKEDEKTEFNALKTQRIEEEEDEGGYRYRETVEGDVQLLDV